MEANNENCIEWISNQHSITCTFSQLKWVNKIKNMEKQYQNKVRILKENSDGTILAKLPLKSLKLSIIERELTDEQREEMSKKFKERMWRGEDKQ